jgi:hypothetical protein
MLIEMTTGLSGPAFTLDPGDRRDFPQDEALRLVAAGYAIPVAEKAIERAINEPVTERRRGRPGKIA